MRDHLPISPYCHYHNHPEYDRRSLPLTNGLIQSYGKVVLDLQCLISHSQIPCPCMHGQRAAVERSDVDVFPWHLFKKVRAVWNPISLKDITMNLKNFSLSLVSSGVNSNNLYVNNTSKGTLNLHLQPCCEWYLFCSIAIEISVPLHIEKKVENAVSEHKLNLHKR